MSPYIARVSTTQGSVPFEQTYSGLLAWYDASRVTGSNGQRLTTITDLSGMGNNLTAVTSGAIYDQTTFFNRPSFSFNGTDTQMTFSARMIPLTGFSIFVVARQTGAAGATRRLIGVESSADGNNALGWYSVAWIIRNGGVNGDVSHNGYVANGTIYSVLVGAGGTAATMTKCNGSAQATGAQSAFTSAGVNFHLGSAGSNDFLFEGYIGEFIAYNRKLSEAGRDSLHNQLNAKWGVF